MDNRKYMKKLFFVLFFYSHIVSLSFFKGGGLVEGAPCVYPWREEEILFIWVTKALKQGIQCPWFSDREIERQRGKDRETERLR